MFSRLSPFPNFPLFGYPPIYLFRSFVFLLLKGHGESGLNYVFIYVYVHVLARYVHVPVAVPVPVVLKYVHVLARYMHVPVAMKLKYFQLTRLFCKLCFTQFRAQASEAQKTANNETTQDFF